MLLEFNDWPDDVVRLCIAKPIISLELDYRLQGENLILLTPDSSFIEVDEVLFPKLGPKSWRDSGRLCATLLDGYTNQYKINNLLNQLSQQQKKIAFYIASKKAPLVLYFYPWIDFTQISELRFHCSEKSKKSMLISYVDRGVRSDAFPYKAIQNCLKFSKCVANYFSDDEIIVDVALLPSLEMKVVEVNPIHRKNPFYSGNKIIV